MSHTTLTGWHALRRRWAGRERDSGPLMAEMEAFVRDERDALSGDQEYRDRDFGEQSLAHRELDNCTFWSCSFVNADLTGARLNASVFHDCNLTGARLAGANLFAAAFDRCKLLGVDFREQAGITLTGVTFTACILDYALFRGRSLAKMDFTGCTLTEADLSLTDLAEATFVNADLTRADITEATFRQTDLRGANLTGWNLRAHDLRGIVITPGQFDALAAELGILILDDASTRLPGRAR